MEAQQGGGRKPITAEEAILERWELAGKLPHPKGAKANERLARLAVDAMIDFEVSDHSGWRSSTLAWLTVILCGILILGLYFLVS